MSNMDLDASLLTVRTAPLRRRVDEVAPDTIRGIVAPAVEPGT